MGQRSLEEGAGGVMADMSFKELFMRVLEKIEPQPPKGIKYMLGGEPWLPGDRRTPVRLHCEEWGNLGPMELDPSIGANKAGLRVRTSEFIAPPGATGFTQVDGKYRWTE